MSKSGKWKTEWAFFLGANGRRQYNRVCKRCVYDCKQSFRATLIACPRYKRKDVKIPPVKGGKTAK